MTYGVITTVTGAVEVDDRLHAALLARTDGTVEGLLLHVGRATADGFQVVEVGESEEHLERCGVRLLC